MDEGYDHGIEMNLDHVPEVSIVMPCLNEADTLATCVKKAQGALAEHRIDGEIIVADNGSTDGSQKIASDLGATVIDVKERGYGAALMGGIESSRGRFVIMGDADDSYDWSQLHLFVEQLRNGADIAQGCRLERGGGRVMPGAMPFLHRWWGNPMFSLMARHWFRAPINDVYCGMRGFTKSAYKSLDQRCTGMEFATEMIIKSSLTGLKFAEVPITLHPDGRKAHAPHLKTFRDGWRTLRFFLLYSPRWLFLLPGFLLMALGIAGYAIALPGYSVNGITFDAHTLLFASLFAILGYQAVVFAMLSKVFAISEGLLPEDRRVNRFFQVFPLERGLVLGAASMIGGFALLLAAVLQWRAVDYGPLDYAHTMRWVIPGVTLTALGFQTILSSFFVSLLGLRRK
jgi:glycosyltransferase involved in cell wall biosynthesis